MTSPTNRPTVSSHPTRALTTLEMMVSATGLTLLMLVMIEAVFLFW
jgi:hypothetical protein